MPELPEVENVKRSLEALGVRGQTFERVELHRANLRTPLAAALTRELPGQTLMAIERRAKFLLLSTERFSIVSHLGMTGSWRVLSGTELIKHDHVSLHFRSGLHLVFNDPRRFGVLELFAREASNRWLEHLGVEPLSPEFNGERLFTATRGVRTPIKSFIMDQKRVVGVGNIYASEALFRAGVRPRRRAARLTREEAAALAQAIKEVLLEAIAAGGSTIRDYRNSNGEQGSFQSRFRVYDRAGEDCGHCGAVIKNGFLTGRNTFWCPRCQR